MNDKTRAIVITAGLTALRPVRTLALRSPNMTRLMLTSGLPLERTLSRIGEWRLIGAVRAANQAPA